MFCVIQKVNVRKAPKGEPRTIEVGETRITDVKTGTSYSVFGWHYSNECFDRPVKPSYRISIHQSYRQGGKVRKKQTAVCTVSYWDIVDGYGYVKDYVCSDRWAAILEVIGVSEDELLEMIYEKYQPIIDRIEAEFQQTEEYAAKIEHRRVLQEHQGRMKAFTEEYGVDEYEYRRCYDAFGTLRNPEYLERIKANYEFRKEYERRSQENQHSYYDNFSSNYRESSYGGISGGNYSADDKTMLKAFYRTLSKTFHPDSNPDRDTSGEMKLLNRLKTEWGV